MAPIDQNASIPSYLILLHMSIKQNFSRQKQSEKDREGNRNFLVVVVLVTVALMVAMYFAFA